MREIGYWNDALGLSEGERRLVKREFRFFVTADSLAANSIELNIDRHIAATGIALHTHAYLHIVDVSQLAATCRAQPCHEAHQLGATAFALPRRAASNPLGCVQHWGPA